MYTINFDNLIPEINNIKYKEYEYQINYSDKKVLFNDASESYTHLMAIEKDDTLLRFILKDASPDNTLVSGNTITYKNAFKDIDIKYDINQDKVKETIIIKDKDAKKSFDFSTLEENIYSSLNEDGSIIYKDNNDNELYTINTPYAYDSNNNELEVYMTNNLSNYTLEVKTDENTVFPIYLDPTIDFNTINYIAGVTSSSTGTRYTNVYLNFDDLGITEGILKVTNKNIVTAGTLYMTRRDNNAEESYVFPKSASTSTVVETEYTVDLSIYKKIRFYAYTAKSSSSKYSLLYLNTITDCNKDYFVTKNNFIISEPLSIESIKILNLTQSATSSSQVNALNTSNYLCDSSGNKITTPCILQPGTYKCNASTSGILLEKSNAAIEIPVELNIDTEKQVLTPVNISYDTKIINGEFIDLSLDTERHYGLLNNLLINTSRDIITNYMWLPRKDSKFEDSNNSNFFFSSDFPKIIPTYIKNYSKSGCRLYGIKFIISRRYNTAAYDRYAKDDVITLNINGINKKYKIKFLTAYSTTGQYVQGYYYELKIINNEPITSINIVNTNNGSYTFRAINRSYDASSGLNHPYGSNITYFYIADNCPLQNTIVYSDTKRNINKNVNVLLDTERNSYGNSTVIYKYDVKRQLINNISILNDLKKVSVISDISNIKMKRTVVTDIILISEIKKMTNANCNSQIKLKKMVIINYLFKPELIRNITLSRNISSDLYRKIIRNRLFSIDTERKTEFNLSNAFDVNRILNGQVNIPVDTNKIINVSSINLIDTDRRTNNIICLNNNTIRKTVVNNTDIIDTNKFIGINNITSYDTAVILVKSLITQIGTKRELNVSQVPLLDTLRSFLVTNKTQLDTIRTIQKNNNVKASILRKISKTININSDIDRVIMLQLAENLDTLRTLKANNRLLIDTERIIAEKQITILNADTKRNIIITNRPCFDTYIENVISNNKVYDSLRKAVISDLSMIKAKRKIIAINHIYSDIIREIVNSSENVLETERKIVRQKVAKLSADTFRKITALNNVLFDAYRKTMCGDTCINDAIRKTALNKDFVLDTERAVEKINITRIKSDTLREIEANNNLLIDFKRKIALNTSSAINTLRCTGIKYISNIDTDRLIFVSPYVIIPVERIVIKDIIDVFNTDRIITAINKDVLDTLRDISVNPSININTLRTVYVNNELDADTKRIVYIPASLLSPSMNLNYNLQNDGLYEVSKDFTNLIVFDKEEVNNIEITAECISDGLEILIVK